MALQLTKSLPNGVDANYWRVSEVNITIGGLIDVTVGLYVSEITRMAGKAPIERIRYVWLPDEFSTALGEKTFNQIRTDIYTKLKTLPEYSEAQDA